MDSNSNRSKQTSHYDRVMPRVSSKSEVNRASYKVDKVVRHHMAFSNTKIRKKPISDASFCVKNDLPIVLNNYEPDDCAVKVPRHPYIVKPRRTLKSLDPPDTIMARRRFAEKPNVIKLIKTPGSAPVLSNKVGMETVRTIASDTKLRELKDEIKSFDDSAKLSHIRSKLFKSCGVLLDEYGCVSIDKGVQVVEDQVVAPRSASLKKILARLKCSH